MELGKEATKEEWEEITRRLFARVEELTQLMEEVEGDLTRYRSIRSEWQQWHNAWKEEYSKRAVG